MYYQCNRCSKLLIDEQPCFCESKPLIIGSIIFLAATFLIFFISPFTFSAVFVIVSFSLLVCAFAFFIGIAVFSILRSKDRSPAAFTQQQQVIQNNMCQPFVAHQNPYVYNQQIYNQQRINIVS